ncbi:MAG: AbiV family abortive infection protein [Candidatus Bathyarchaeia archaeon]
MGNPDRIIPLTRLPEGLRLCAQNIRDFVVDAEQLLSKGHDYHAVALAIFAFEELGKYSELKKLGEEATKTGTTNVTVKDDLFRLHDYKQNIAKQLLPVDTMILIPAYFSDIYFSPKYFRTKAVKVEPSLRLECVFVDWINDDWRYGTPHDTERLKKFLGAIIDALNKLGG